MAKGDLLGLVQKQPNELAAGDLRVRTLACATAAPRFWWQQRQEIASIPIGIALTRRLQTREVQL